jgi:hypothetical protein
MSDTTKFLSLGPYSLVMGRIVEYAISKREDELDSKKFHDLDLFRGTRLTDA